MKYRMMTFSAAILLSSAAWAADSTATMATEPQTNPNHVLTLPKQGATSPSAMPANSAQTSATTQADTKNYMSGGVGEQDRQQLEAMQNNYNVKMTTAESTGAYLADIPVKITNASGETVIETVTEGPLFFAKLEPGTYTIEATHNGIAKTQKITAGENQKALVFQWKATESQANNQL
ncbi:MAG: hypothetical protein CMM93_06225 [Rickettsiales bacterium]|nr:hypothetical protein [Rickettsiales bacterium]|tara:strand:+ start:3998 stop:4531 length:534 start_codon:yes stop_codon:yes gene_type:complete